MELPHPEIEEMMYAWPLSSSCRGLDGRVDFRFRTPPFVMSLGSYLIYGVVQPMYQRRRGPTVSG